MHRSKLPLISLFILTLAVISPAQVSAGLVTDSEMELVSKRWLSLIAEEPDGWAGSRDPRIVAMTRLEDEAGVLAHVYHTAPVGYIVVPVIRELPPIKAYSTTSSLDVSETQGFAQLLRESLRARLDRFVELHGSLDAHIPGPSTPGHGQMREGDISDGPRTAGRFITGEPDHRATWDLLLDGPERFSEGRKDAQNRNTAVGPLLATSWHQNAPYNQLAPMGDGGQCLVGCVATAAAQVMKYYNWPPAGTGSKQYWWNGDQSCGGSTAGQYLYADFSNPYDWANMPNHCNSVCNPTQQAALAELNYEVGVAFSMDFGRCGSGAYTSWALSVMPQYFDYSSQMQNQNRSSHSVDSWFQVIRNEINNGRPMLYSFRYDASSGHAVVCDGWAEMYGERQYHINYGWGGQHTTWYTIDNIYHSQDPMQEVLYRRIMPADPWTVTVAPDGSGDYATIQAAVDAVFGGCVVELADGVYTGAGNHSIRVNAREITIRSQNGDPSLCVIDCEGSPGNLRSGFIFDFGESPAVVIEGITIANGYAASGGGVRIEAASSPTFINCVFLNNTATGEGGGAYVADDSSPSFIGCRFEGNVASTVGGGLRFRFASGLVQSCVFTGNHTPGAGGGIHLRASSPTIDGCTFHGNSAVGTGAGITMGASSSPVIRNTIISFSEQGTAMHIVDAGSQPVVSCCCIFGNEGGPGSAAGYIGANGNFADNPLFCDGENGDFSLCADSPCLPGVGPCGDLVGAIGAGCGACGEGASVPEIAAQTGRLYLAPCAPNPFNSTASITYAVPVGEAYSPVNLSVYSPSGRLVRTLVQGEVGAGVHGAEWDGRDGEGRSVASGIYYIRLAGGGGGTTRSILLLR